MAVQALPLAVFAAGAALVGAGVVAAVEVASVTGLLLIGGAFLGLLWRR